MVVRTALIVVALVTVVSSLKQYDGTIHSVADFDIMMSRHQKRGGDKLPDCRQITSKGAEAPHIIHLMYFPWNKTTQTLNPNEKDFDHSFYQRMVASPAVANKFCVKLWTYSSMRVFVRSQYPGLWEFVEKRLDRPVQLVDLYRILVVYEYGGIFWQYGSELANSLKSLPSPYESFLPPSGKQVRLLTEKIMTPEMIQGVLSKPIRKGIPCSAVRIATQVFGAKPLADFLRFSLKTAVTNLVNNPILHDFDILETMGNGMFSEAYNEYMINGTDRALVDVVSENASRTMAKYSHSFSWRREKGRCC